MFPEPILFQRDRMTGHLFRDQGPVLMEPRHVVIAPTPAQILEEALALVEEVEQRKGKAPDA